MSNTERVKWTPQSALDRLKSGNARFLSNEMVPRDSEAQLASTAEGQNPFAVILTCADSRTSPELIFDLDLGDVMCLRVAGNVLNTDILASMEFACHFAGAKLIVVMGHSACGAVEGACDGVQLEHLSSLLKKITPAIDSVAAEHRVRDADFVQKVTEQNALNVVRDIRGRSETLSSAMSEGSLGIVRAMYSLKTGVAVFDPLVQ